MKKAGILEFAALIVLTVAHAHAATARLAATATVTGSCAVVAPASIPYGSADVSVINVSCSSGTPSSVGLSINDVNPNAPASGVPEVGAMATVSY
ncbi:MAG: hypothetical protein Q8L80_01665 [Gallionella sp.]|nr:hypothetical protein [Gallionella sp.]MDP1939647.1 hypothetical protein [Gallionella sp.]